LLKKKFEDAKKMLAGTAYEKLDPLPEPVWSS